MSTTFRTQRLSRGWRLKDLAERCLIEGVNTDTSHLSRIERDVWAPQPALRAVLCRLLDLPITYFDHDQREQRQEAVS